jgi:hypothetical protein
MVHGSIPNSEQRTYLFSPPLPNRNWRRAVGVAITLWTWCSRFRTQVRSSAFLFFKTFRISPSYSMASFLGLWRPGLEVNNSLPSSVDVRNECRCTSTPFVCLYGAEKERFISLFTYYPSVHTGSEAQSNFYWIGMAAFPPGFNRLEHAADLSPLLHPHTSKALYLLKYRDTSS